MNIAAKDIKKFIDHHFHKDLKKDLYEIVKVNPKNLLTNNRFDLSFKLFYLELKEKNIDLATSVYKEHIKAFSLGKYIEPGNANKNSFEKYLYEFEKIFDNIKSEGFNQKKSLIPLDVNKSISNGSHRTASSIFLNRTVYTVDLKTKVSNYDYNFFRKRNISNDILDIAAAKYVKYSDNIYSAVVWPSAVGKENEIEKIIPNIVYKKRVKLNPNGAHNIISQIYYGEDWLGYSDSNFKGAKSKLIECFKNFNALKIYFFNADSLKKVANIKNTIRDLFKIGKHSIHISDTKKEAQRIANLVLNKNAIHFLNYAKPNKLENVITQIEAFKSKKNKNDYIVDGDFIFSLYGIRQGGKINILTTDNTFYKESVNFSTKDLIFDQRNYFKFNDIKFLSFEKTYLIESGKNYLNNKEIKIIKSFINDRSIYVLLRDFSNYYNYTIIKINSSLINLLKKIRLYKIIKLVYRKIIKMDNN